MSKPSQEELVETAQTAAVAAATVNGPQTRAVLRIIVIILAVAAVVWVLHALLSVLLLVIVSIFFAYLISPLVQAVQRPFSLRGQSRVLPRSAAIGLVYVALFGTLGAAGYLLLPRMGRQLSDFAHKAPTYLMSARGRAQELEYLYGKYNLPLTTREAINSGANQAYDGMGALVQERAKGALEALLFLPWLIIIPILAFFLLKDAGDFQQAALRALPRGHVRWRGRELFDDLNLALAAYIRAQLAGCLVVAVACAAGLALLRVPYALVLGGIAGCLEFIPMLGPVLFLALAALIAGFQPDGSPLGVILFLGVLRVIEDYVVYPRIIKNGIHLHPLAVILAILCGAELGGVIGVFLAIPVVAVLTVVYKHWLLLRGSDGLVAELLQPVPPPPAAPAAAAPPTPPEVPVSAH